ncbi:MAG: hypothetical protein JWQ87_3680 [Candidatus Sulfotelmatobacter sp.]|nr:hypothetical protein [Candidatus Sulfotelmatobacter sp.]
MAENETGTFERSVASFGSFDQILRKIKFGLPQFGRGITPFTVREVLDAVADDRVDSRSHQSSELNAECLEVCKGDVDAAIAWSRKFHIERVAFFVKNGWDDPIELTEDKWSDGSHRLLAAVVKGDITIKCYAAK